MCVRVCVHGAAQCNQRLLLVILGASQLHQVVLGAAQLQPALLECSDMLEDAQPEEDDGDCEEADTGAVEGGGAQDDVGQVDAHRPRQQDVHQPIKDVPGTLAP